MKKPDIDALLVSKDISKSIIELESYISELCNRGENMKQLTQPQKNFFYNQNLEKEINSGGFRQYFHNPGGDFAHETVVSLKEIHAEKAADILQSAIDQFPTGEVPEDRTERHEELAQMGEKANEIWEQLDKRFMNYEEDLDALHIEYVRQNRDSFL